MAADAAPADTAGIEDVEHHELPDNINTMEAEQLAAVLPLGGSNVQTYKHAEFPESVPAVIIVTFSRRNRCVRHTASATRRGTGRRHSLVRSLLGCSIGVCVDKWSLRTHADSGSDPGLGLRRSDRGSTLQARTTDAAGRRSIDACADQR